MIMHVCLRPLSLLSLGAARVRATWKELLASCVAASFSRFAPDAPGWCLLVQSCTCEASPAGKPVSVTTPSNDRAIAPFLSPVVAAAALPTSIDGDASIDPRVRECGAGEELHRP